MKPIITKKWTKSISDRISPMCDKCASILPSSASLSLFHFQTTCFQMCITSSVSLVFVGNWLPKWHPALRNNRLRAIDRWSIRTVEKKAVWVFAVFLERLPLEPLIKKTQDACKIWIHLLYINIAHWYKLKSQLQSSPSWSIYYLNHSSS